MAAVPHRTPLKRNCCVGPAGTAGLTKRTPRNWTAAVDNAGGLVYSPGPIVWSVTSSSWPKDGGHDFRSKHQPAGDRTSQVHERVPRGEGGWRVRRIVTIEASRNPCRLSPDAQRRGEGGVPRLSAALAGKAARAYRVSVQPRAGLPQVQGRLHPRSGRLHRGWPGQTGRLAALRSQHAG